MLQVAVDRLTYSVLGLDPGSRLGGAINFFIYDSLKILLLLSLMIFVMGVLRSFLPQRRVKDWLARRGVAANFFASLFGAVTPFCSCSSIPIFLGFVRAGIPLGIAFSFLITSPLINEYLVVLMIGFFGWRITALYVASGIFLGVLCGFFLGKMGLERYLAADLAPDDGGAGEPVYENFRARVLFALREVRSIVFKLWGWVLAGVGIGALIHNYVPQEMINSLIGRTGFFSVPIATLIGVPIYASCAAIVPVAVVLFQKGVPLGTALAFMMATSALSLPEAVMLRRAMKLKLVAVFFGITAFGIMLTGYLFNYLQKLIV